MSLPFLRAHKWAAVAVMLSMGAAASASAQNTEGLRYKQIPDNAYAVVAQVQAKPGKEAALRQITLPLVAKVRREHNNLLYFLQEDREKPGHFVFYEIFATQADFEAHNTSPHVQAWFAQLPELAEGGVTATHMEILNNAANPAPN